MRFVIGHIWSDENRGDSALTQGIIDILRKNFPSARIEISLMLDNEQEVRHLKEINNNLNVNRQYLFLNEGSLIADSFIILRLKQLHFSFRVIREYLRYFLGFKNKNLRCFDDAIAIFKGGSNLHDHGNSFMGFISSLYLLLPILYATRYSKKTLLVSQSLGPFRNKLTYYVYKAILSRCNYIGNRESLSFNFSKSFNVNVSREIDTAFFSRVKKSEKVRDFIARYSLQEKHFIIITPRQLYDRETVFYKDYLDILLKFAKDVKQKYGYEIVFFPHTTGPSKVEDDTICIRQLRDLSLNGNFVFITERHDLDFQEVAYLYSTSYATVGTRLHSIILTLISNTPVISISDRGTKLIGILSDLGLDGFSFRVDNLRLGHLLAAFDIIVKQRTRLDYNKIEELKAATEKRIVEEILR